MVVNGLDVQVEVEPIEEAMGRSQNAKAFKLGRGEVRISPQYIKTGQTAVMEFVENSDQSSGSDKPQALWEFAGYVITGPVQPCKVVKDPSWDKLPDPKTNPEAYPPAGS